jgi:hypothetical protein
MSKSNDQIRIIKYFRCNVMSDEEPVTRYLCAVSKDNSPPWESKQAFASETSVRKYAEDVLKRGNKALVGIDAIIRNYVPWSS